MRRLTLPGLAALIVAAQLGAGLHAGGHPVDGAPENRGMPPACGHCLASAQLQVGVGAAAPALPARLPPRFVTLTPRAASASRSPGIRAFRSRAPPVLA